MSAAIALIAGLGNPGSSYEPTRHNAGFWFMDALAKQYHVSFANESRFHGQTARVTIGECPLYLLKPGAYMNRSGQSVAALCRYYRIPVSQVLIVHDELDLDAGTVRLKQGGGHGGHNGLRDIITSFSGDAGFYRMRIGIGHPGNSREVVDYVLQKPGKQDRESIGLAIDAALESLPALLEGDVGRVQQQLHSRGKASSAT